MWLKGLNTVEEILPPSVGYRWIKLSGRKHAVKRNPSRVPPWQTRQTPDKKKRQTLKQRGGSRYPSIKRDGSSKRCMYLYKTKIMYRK